MATSIHYISRDPRTLLDHAAAGFLAHGGSAPAGGSLTSGNEAPFPQDVYVAAGDAISPRAVGSFGFVFSRPGTSVINTLDAAERGNAAARVRALTVRMGNAPGAYATNPRECFMCGYRRARLCAGAPADASPPSTTPDAEPT